MKHFSTLSLAVALGCGEPPTPNAPPVGGGSQALVEVLGSSTGTSEDASSSTGTGLCELFLYCVRSCGELSFGGPKETETLIQECLATCEASPLPPLTQQKWVQACLAEQAAECVEGLEACQHFES